MRPLRLDLAGFTVFREETTVDFTDADFFALVGPTGSGKSSILDAICFALYGQVPRWGSSRGIASALAPSANEARVRLVFESAGSRYVATRVIRRDARGVVKTGNAGLQLMPPGFDVTRLDTGMSPDDLGDVLAGTPAEMEQAVLDAVGLPYEQFTTCVLLPQGRFADFLHAKPATRQQILVNLLGLHVYERIQKQATARATTAEAAVAAVDQLLGGLADADAAAVDAAVTQLDAIRTLTAAVEAALPELEQAHRTVASATDQVTGLDGDIGLLGRVEPPAAAAALAGEVATARATAAEAEQAVTVAEEREEKIRAELAAAGDPATLRLLVQAHAERDRVAAESAELAPVVASAQTEHEASVAALRTARAAAATADAELEQARRAYQEAQTADLAAALRHDLAAGDDCPVCERPVGVVPAVPAGSRVAEAKAAGQVARATADRAQQQVTAAEQAVREVERALDRARVRAEQLGVRLAQLDTELSASPGVEAVRAELAGVDRLQSSLDDAGGKVRRAREAARRSQRAAVADEQRLQTAWREFDAVRDTVARLAPPATDRSDLATAWTQLAGWAQELAADRRAARVTADAELSAARAAADSVGARADELFVAAGLRPPGADSSGTPQPAEYRQAAALAVQRAQSEHDRVVERFAQAGELRQRRAEQERSAQVARTLAGHLRANNFERWLLVEALDLLVDGASLILRELSSGQYELVHDAGEFFVVDHHDAGLRRGVRTLSGGETFQASLALALALSEQLAGMSTSAASLESIVLDEGFGSLDAATLDTVAATLEGLAARGDRMVGLVTHVPALAERVPVRFEVRKDARTASVHRSGM
ncbi:SMC family ATPase [Micromonospora sp. NBC_01813]|uniref:SMC family ATPase n=1 Tax=Micromonospora sp. NBC_01813 TaxID=2975988 RepID=UPI002DD92A8C|nr:SMC family ATPase [Micromonospora sp. NBC_01813]WSA11448.1 SMC family ATPase [Micromonospora sp. NBC_01813]